MTDDDRMSELRALAHPVRLQILSLLTGAELSAAEVARELGLTHANASYHLRTLHAAGELIDRRRGAHPRRRGQALPPRVAPLAGRRPARRAGPRTPPRFVRAAASELVRRYAARATGRRPGRTGSPTPSSGSTPTTSTARVRAGRGGQPPAPRRRAAAADRGHRPGQHDQRDVPDGRLVSSGDTDPAATPSRPCADRRSAWYFAARLVNLARHDDGARRAGLRGARPCRTRRAPSASVLAAQSIPLVVFLLVGGVIADRFDRAPVLRSPTSAPALSQGASPPWC